MNENVKSFLALGFILVLVYLGLMFDAWWINTKLEWFGY